MTSNAHEREPLLTAEYFDKDVAYEQNDAIPKFEKKLAGDVPDKKQRARLRFVLFQKKLHLIISRYSRGDDVAELPALLPCVVEALALYQSEDLHEPFDIQSVDDYQTALWLLSLAITFRADPATCEKLVALISNQGRDALVDSLIKQLTPLDRPTIQLLHPALTQSLYAATQASPPNQAACLKDHLQSWYSARSDVYWHDNHKGPEGGGFFGYWSIEAAGVVVAFGMDDVSFQDMRYYPKDLVAYYRARQN